MTVAVEQAISNTIGWCRVLCRTHGISTAEGDGFLYAERLPPVSCPDLMTSQRGVLPTTVAGILDGRYDASVMDSYAELALDSRGYMRLFDAEWLHRRVSPAAGTTPADGWEVVPREARYSWSAAAELSGIIQPELFSQRDVRIFGHRKHGRYTAGFIAFRTEGTAGISGVFRMAGGEADDAGRRLWRDLAALVCAQWPEVTSLVARGRAAQKRLAEAAGFRSVGKYTVWLRDS
jgi:hypothetical protein